LKDRKGWTPLICAANGGHQATVSLLLSQHNTDAQSSDINSRTALSWAASKGHEAVIELLITDPKGDKSSRDSAGLTPLMWAVRKSQESAVACLIKHGYPLDERDRDFVFSQLAISMMHKSFQAMATAMGLEVNDFTFGLRELFGETE